MWSCSSGSGGHISYDCLNSVGIFILVVSIDLIFISYLVCLCIWIDRKVPFLCLLPVPLNVFVHTTAYQPSTLLFDLIFLVPMKMICLHCVWNMRRSTNKPLKHTHLLTHQHLHLHSQTLLGYGGYEFWTGGLGPVLGLECLNLEEWIQTLNNNWGLACHMGQPVTLVGSWLWCQSTHSVQKPGRRWGSAVPSTAGPDWWWWRWRLAQMNLAFPLRHWPLARCPQCSSQLPLTHNPEQEIWTNKSFTHHVKPP